MCFLGRGACNGALSRSRCVLQLGGEDGSHQIDDPDGDLVCARCEQPMAAPVLLQCSSLPMAYQAGALCDAYRWGACYGGHGMSDVSDTEGCAVPQYWDN